MSSGTVKELSGQLDNAHAAPQNAPVSFDRTTTEESDHGRSTVSSGVLGSNNSNKILDQGEESIERTFGTLVLSDGGKAARYINQNYWSQLIDQVGNYRRSFLSQTDKIARSMI